MGEAWQVSFGNRPARRPCVLFLPPPLLPIRPCFLGHRPAPVPRHTLPMGRGCRRGAPQQCGRPVLPSASGRRGSLAVVFRAPSWRSVVLKYSARFISEVKGQEGVAWQGSAWDSPHTSFPLPGKQTPLALPEAGHRSSPACAYFTRLPFTCSSGWQISEALGDGDVEKHRSVFFRSVFFRTVVAGSQVDSDPWCAWVPRNRREQSVGATLRVFTKAFNQLIFCLRFFIFIF